jgi:hypothetical protein
MRLHELDVVRVVRIIECNRPYSGTESVCRPPRVGDRGAIVSVPTHGYDDAPYTVESVTPEGYTLWLADFLPDELELIARPGASQT